MGSVQFQIAPRSSLYFSVSTGPFRCSRCYLQGFNLLHGPFWSGSLCSFGFCLLASSVPNFRPDTGGRRWPLIQVASSVALRGGAGPAFPVGGAAQAPGCSVWSVPCAARGSSPRVFHKSRELKAAPAFCAFPARAAQAARSLTGGLSPGAARLLPSVSPAPVPALAGRVPAPCVSPGPSRRMSTIQNLRRSLVRNWRPVCSAVGDAFLGAKPAPCPFPLPPASCLQQGWAGPQPASSSLDLLRPFVLRTAGSVFGPVNFLSLSRYLTV